MVCVRVAFHENDGNRENGENDEDNSDIVTNKELSAGFAEITETIEMTKTTKSQGANHVGTRKGGHYKRGRSLEESLECLKSLDSLGNGSILLCFPRSGGFCQGAGEGPQNCKPSISPNVPPFGRTYIKSFSRLF